MEKVKIGETELILTNGTMLRVPNEPPQYLDVGTMENGNRIMFYYPDATEIVDYVGTVIENLPNFAAQYLEEVLNGKQNIFVRCWYVAGAHNSSYEIYYNCGCESNDLFELISWMGKNNDWNAKEFCFTEVINGHQKCVGE